MGKRVLVTGGASGIGEATAGRFLREGAHVVVLDRSRENLAAAAERLQPVRSAGAELFLASDDAAFITGEALVIDGGQLVE